ncbi:MAG TPA: Do family serine endopeptidase [Candidatus Paceibacterota bacterium]|nr:Do family serine endopeptidase [Candidatus Paceibacterota bacterium]
MKSFSKLMVGAVAATVAAVAMAALFHGASWGKDATPVINVESTPVNRDATPVTSYAPVVKKAAPSVVNIYTTRIIHLRAMGGPFDNPFFRRFYGNQSQDDSRELTQKEQILGSGVIVSPDGYILTANHVVSGEEEIKVAFGDGSKKEYTAKVIGTDRLTDIAVLKIDATNLPAITLGDSDQLEVGDVVLAIGNPYGVGQTVTMGIISGLGRHNFGINGPNDYEDFIQTDASINEGNSGGALVDAEGRLIGINTWIATETGGSVGLGFSVPINMARHVMERLIAGGKVTRGFLGVVLQDIDASLATYFKLPDQNGALVDDVRPGTAAAKGGIRSGDVIVSFNDKPVTDANNLILDVSDSQPGTEVTLKLIRDGNAKTVTATLGEKPGEVAQNANVQNNSKPASSGTDALDGVTIADLDQATRRQLGIPNNVQGVLVTDVAQDSNSAEADLEPGDVIVEINRQPAGNAENAINFAKLAKGDRIILKIWRRDGNLGSTRYLSVDNTK